VYCEKISSYIQFEIIRRVWSLYEQVEILLILPPCLIISAKGSKNMS